MGRYKSDTVFHAILELSKVRITVAVAFTTITGYILARGGYDSGLILPTIGIFFLACGSSAFNHIQESRSDARMKRTRLRPLPAKRLTLKQAYGVAITETLAGSLLLYLSSGTSAMLLGLLAMVWYNGIYTPLKRITPHAVIPGSVIGSIPPLVGWVAAGGSLISAGAGIMALFFFVWQVPHFYLLAIKYGPEYETASLPSVTSVWTDPKARKAIFFWILLTAITGLILSVSRLPASLISRIVIAVASGILILAFLPVLTESDLKVRFFRYFMRVNYYVLLVTAALMAGPFLQRLSGI